MKACEECIRRVVEQLGCSQKVARLLVELRERNLEDPRGMVHVSPSEVERMRGKVGDVQKESRNQQRSLFGGN